MKTLFTSFFIFLVVFTWGQKVDINFLYKNPSYDDIIIIDGTNIKLIDTKTKKIKSLLIGHNENIFNYAISPEKSLLASIDVKGVIVVWDLKAQKRKYTFSAGEIINDKNHTTDIKFMFGGEILSVEQNCWNILNGTKITNKQESLISIDSNLVIVNQSKYKYVFRNWKDGKIYSTLNSKENYSTVFSNSEVVVLKGDLTGDYKNYNQNIIWYNFKQRKIIGKANCGNTSNIIHNKRYFVDPYDALKIYDLENGRLLRKFDGTITDFYNGTTITSSFLGMNDDNAKYVIQLKDSVEFIEPKNLKTLFKIKGVVSNFYGDNRLSINNEFKPFLRLNYDDTFFIWDLNKQSLYFKIKANDIIATDYNVFIVEKYTKEKNRNIKHYTIYKNKPLEKLLEFDANWERFDLGFEFSRINPNTKFEVNINSRFEIYDTKNFIKQLSITKQNENEKIDGYNESYVVTKLEIDETTKHYNIYDGKKGKVLFSIKEPNVDFDILYNFNDTLIIGYFKKYKHDAYSYEDSSSLNIIMIDTKVDAIIKKINFDNYKHNSYYSFNPPPIFKNHLHLWMKNFVYDIANDKCLYNPLSKKIASQDTSINGKFLIMKYTDSSFGIYNFKKDTFYNTTKFNDSIVDYSINDSLDRLSVELENSYAYIDLNINKLSTRIKEKKTYWSKDYSHYFFSRSKIQKITFDSTESLIAVEHSSYYPNSVFDFLNGKQIFTRYLSGNRSNFYFNSLGDELVEGSFFEKSSSNAVYNCTTDTCYEIESNRIKSGYYHSGYNDEDTVVLGYKILRSKIFKKQKQFLKKKGGNSFTYTLLKKQDEYSADTSFIFLADSIHILVYTSSNNKLGLYNTQTEKFVWTKDGFRDYLTLIKVFEKQNTLMYVTYGNYVTERIFQVHTINLMQGTIVHSIVLPSLDNYANATLNKIEINNKAYGIANSTNSLCFINPANGKIVFAYCILNSNQVYAVSTKRNIIITTLNNQLKFYQLSTGKPLYTYIPLDENNFIVYDEEGHYDASENALQYVYYSCGNKVVPASKTNYKSRVVGLVQKIMSNQKHLITAPTKEDLNICNLVE